jgi:hypothetical protein
MENQITVADLNLIKNIINLACTRGAFQGGEMKEVGVVYEKLTNFLDVIVAQAKANAEAESADISEKTGE